jgi:hypothetical protein
MRYVTFLSYWKEKQNKHQYSFSGTYLGRHSNRLALPLSLYVRFDMFQPKLYFPTRSSRVSNLTYKTLEYFWVTQFDWILLLR